MLPINRKVIASILFTLALGVVMVLGSQRVGMAQSTTTLADPALMRWYPTPQQAAGIATSSNSTSHSSLPGLEIGQATPLVAQGYQPPMIVRPANPTNYGPRFTQDINGNPVNNPWIIVLHETVGSGTSAINTIQAAQPDESRQVSYHAIILRNGTIAFLVPPEYRAFGAGDSVFIGPNGPEAIRTHPKFPPSVNNFSYHISLETPADGRGNQSVHSGYTPAQYRSLVWLVAQTKVPANRITTHRAVDRSGQRRDPRSFNRALFQQMLSTIG